MTHLGKFSHEFSTAIKHNSLWKWVTSEPSFLSNICNLCSRFIGYLCHLKPACGRMDHCKATRFKRFFPFSRDRIWSNKVYTYCVPGICFSVFRWQFAIFLIRFFLLFCMLGISYTHRGLFCKGLSSQNVDRGCVLFEFLLDGRASHYTNLQFSSIVPEVSIFCYFGILNDGFDCPHERCRGYSLCVRLAFVVV